MDFIIEATVNAIKTLYQADVDASAISLQQTRKEFEGQVTIVTFPFTKVSRKSPEQTGAEIGEFLKNELQEVGGFNVVKGFLNLSMSDSYWLSQVYNNILLPDFAISKPNGKRVMVEYSSPNTNKPLHLGHVRNNLLGYSVASILAAAGYDVIKANLVNDRGIHICKSMLAWLKWGNEETPESANMKGDHLVGKYYVIFEQKLKKELEPILNSIYGDDFQTLQIAKKAKIEEHLQKIALLKSKVSAEIKGLNDADVQSFGPGFDTTAQSIIDGTISVKKALDELTAKFDANNNQQVSKRLATVLKPAIEIEKKIAKEEDDIKEMAKGQTPLMLEAQQMLQKWEAGDAEVINLWKTMNSWVYAGFAETYKKLGVDFDKYYYESDTYLLGKDIVEEGLEKQVFYQKPDGSVWIDLTSDGLDEKLVRRADGTSVYMTQDLGTAQLKYNDFQMNQSLYVVGNEQDYHFKVLFLILQKLGKSWAQGLYHLSYGMVDLPSGKMKSREGTVVDADDLISEMQQTAKKVTEELGKVANYSEDEKIALYHTIGMGALKYFLLKVEPKKRLLFDPNESIDFQGHTGPFIQYTHARIKSVISKAEFSNESAGVTVLDPVERDLIITLTQYPETISTAAQDYNPAAIANYVYELAKAFNKFYHEKSILQAEDEQSKQFRLQLASASARVISGGMKLLGIEVPERM